MKRLLQTIFAVSLALSLSGCGKKDDAKKDDKAAKSKSIEEKAKDTFGGMMEVVKKNQDDCDKLGTELEKFVTDNKATIKEITEHTEKLKPEDKKKFDKAAGESEDNEKLMMGAFMKCMENKNFEKAMKAMEDVSPKKKEEAKADEKKDEPKADEKKDEEKKDEEKKDEEKKE